MSFERIVVDHQIMGGVPCIRGTRMPVTRLVKMVAAGMTIDQIQDDFPQLTADDVHEALLYTVRSSTRRHSPDPAGQPSPGGRTPS